MSRRGVQKSCLMTPFHCSTLRVPAILVLSGIALVSSFLADLISVCSIFQTQILVQLRSCSRFFILWFLAYSVLWGIGSESSGYRVVLVLKSWVLGCAGLLGGRCFGVIVDVHSCALIRGLWMINLLSEG